MSIAIEFDWICFNLLYLLLNFTFSFRFRKRGRGSDDKFDDLVVQKGPKKAKIVIKKGPKAPAPKTPEASSSATRSGRTPKKNPKYNK